MCDRTQHNTSAPYPRKPPFTALVNNVIYFVYDVQGICLLFDVILMIGLKKINRCTVNGHECACCLGLWLYLEGGLAPSSDDERKCWS